MKSEEEEAFEQKVEYILQHKAQNKATVLPLSDYSPLTNLSPEQEKQVLLLLHDLPSNPNKPGTIKLALVVQYLKALENLDKANLADLYNLRLWVAKITEKEVPESSQFNEAVHNCTASKVTKSQKDLMRILS